jgi:pimeloyl-ACP methyl ester carboxylesterase
MVNRFPERIVRQVLWNATVPFLPEEYAAAGIDGDMIAEVNEVTDHLDEHGNHADQLMEKLNTAEKRRGYVKGFYQGRVRKRGGEIRGLAAMGSFDDEAAAFHAEPFGDGEVFRASLLWYETVLNPELFSEPPLLAEAGMTETMFLYGVEDCTIGPRVTRRAEVAYKNLIGPFTLDRGGHFLSWERPRVVNGRAHHLLPRPTERGSRSCPSRMRPLRSAVTRWARESPQAPP